MGAAALCFGAVFFIWNWALIMVEGKMKTCQFWVPNLKASGKMPFSMTVAQKHNQQRNVFTKTTSGPKESICGVTGDAKPI